MSHLQVTSHNFSETEKKKIVEAVRAGSVNKIIDTVLGARDAYLREHQRTVFAAAALTGLLANPNNDPYMFTQVCDNAWNVADRMIEREGE